MHLRWPETPVGRWRLALLFAATLLSLAIVFQPPPWTVFAEAGEKMRVADYVVAYSWIAAAINIMVLAALVLLCPWWANAPRTEALAGVAERGLAPKWFWPSVLAAVVACTLLTAPRLTQSLWDDEETSLRFSVLGKYKRDAETGEVFLKEAKWRETLFFYETPNNHVLHNVLARLSNAAWRSATRPDGLQFTEWALRIPAFLAGLATLIVVAILLKEMGLPLAGVLGVWALALHPWFTKYCAEARGYTLAMLLLYAALLFWRRALERGAWKWWALFALCQALCLWTWPGALFFFVLLNLGTLGLAAVGRQTAQPRRTILSRWFCANALAGVALIQLMLPLFPQMGGYLEQLPTLDIGKKWFADVACYLATGSPWTKNETGEILYPEIRAASAAAPAVFSAAMVLGSGLLATGIWRWFKTGALATTILVAAFGASALQVAQAIHERMFLFEWYFVYLLPLLCVIFGAGLATCVLFLRTVPGGKVTATLAVASVFCLFAFVTQPARARGLTSSTVPFRESVLLTRPNLDPHAEDNRQIMTAGMTNPAFVYDANLFLARSLRDLLLLCAQADATRRPLWVNLGHTWILRERQPDTQKLIDDHRIFTDHRTLLGEYPHCDRLVCRYVPGSLESVDLSQLLSPEDIAYVKTHAGVTPEKHFAQ